MLEKIKYYFYKTALKRELSKSPPIDRQMINIDKAQKIGILYNASKVNDVIAVTEFSDMLKGMGKSVTMLGFQNIKPKKNETLAKGIFNKEAVNWFYKPSSKEIYSFKKEHFDILICAFIDKCFPLEYIANVSLAKFRVGHFNQASTDAFELMINTGEKKDLKYLLNQINHFLKVINKNG